MGEQSVVTEIEKDKARNDNTFWRIKTEQLQYKTIYWGDASDVEVGDLISYEIDKDGQSWNLEDVEIVDKGAGGDSSDSSASSDSSGENMGRQKPIEAVGRMFQGEPPTTPEELNNMKAILKELTSWSNKGEFVIDPETLGQEVDLEGEVADSINELSERIGKLEQEMAEEDDANAATVEDFNELHDAVEELDARLETLEKAATSDDSDDEEDDVIFGEDDEPPEDASELQDDGSRENSKVNEEDDDGE